MQVASFGPLAVATLVWEPEPGQHSVTTIVKATLDLVHGAEAALTDPLPILPDVHEDDDPRASLRAPSDWAPIKPRVDVVLVGHAHAPGGVPVTELPVTLAVGGFSKTVWVYGDRVWVGGPGGLVPSAPAPFTRMPLRYERAAHEADNPIGVHVTGLVALGAPAAPNLEPGDGAVVACFAPIPPSFPSRRARTDAEGARWLRRVAGSPPAGFDYGFFNAAPIDQQLDMLRGGAVVRIENARHDRPVLETRLPPLRPRAYLLSPRSPSPREVALRADTLWIDTDRAVATLTFRGLASIDERDDDEAVLAVVVETPEDPRAQRHVDELFRSMRGGVVPAAVAPGAPVPRQTSSIRWDEETTVTRVRKLAPLAPGALGGKKGEDAGEGGATTHVTAAAAPALERELAAPATDSAVITYVALEDPTIADPPSADMTDPDGGRTPLLALGISRLGVESSLSDAPLDDTTAIDPLTEKDEDDGVD